MTPAQLKHAEAIARNSHTNAAALIRELLAEREELLGACQGYASWFEKWGGSLTIEEKWTEGWEELKSVENAGLAAINRASPAPSDPT